MKKGLNSKLRLHQDIISLQLLESAVNLINYINEYCSENGIVLNENPKLNRMLNEAKTLLEEDVFLSEKTSIRRIFTKEKSDDNFTEPEGSYVFLHLELHYLWQDIIDHQSRS